MLVAELAGRVVGFIGLQHPSGLRSGAHVLLINGLAVDPAMRRRGVARALVDGAVDASRERGVRRLRLRVLSGNAPARELYAAAGFQVEGVLHEEFCIDGGYVDDVLMARSV